MLGAGGGHGEEILLADAARFLGTMKDRLEGAAFEAEIGL